MEADLRLMLLSLGVIFLVWIVVDAWRRRPKTFSLSSTKINTDEPEESEFDSLAAVGIIGKPRKIKAVPHANEPEVLRPFSKAASGSPKNTQQSDKPIGLIIRGRGSVGFEGAKLHSAIAKQALCWDERGLYHRHQNNDASGNCYYTVSLAVEPGTFSTATRYERVPAILLLLTAPGNLICEEGFNDMLITGQRISQELNGKMCRINGSALKLDDIDAMRQQLVLCLESIPAE